MTQIIILAAGKGTRMGSDLPKVLVPLNGRPMIHYLMDSVVSSATDIEPIVVVSPDNHQVIKDALSSYDVSYAIQKQQLGTGHAVASARDLIKSDTKNIVVLYGDHPFLSSESIKKFANLNPESVTIVPTVLPNFSNWYQNFYGWGRIKRNELNEVEQIVELKDASEDEKKITEVNPGFMCFNKDWLFKNIDKLQDNNKAHEFYLTDMIGLAFSEGYKVDTVFIEPREAMGINKPEELKIAEDLGKN